MTTNKPGVLGYFAEYQKAGGQFRLSTNHFETRHDAVRFAFIDVRAVPVIRLSDYEALQAEFVIRLDELSARNYELRMGLAEKTSECEKLRKAVRRLCNLYVVDDYYFGDMREVQLSRAVEWALAAHRKQGGDV